MSGPEGASTPRIGLALGAGGAAGLAHIPGLEILDDLGIRPHHVAGTSIGAVIGGLYASGMPGARLREIAAEFGVRESDSWRDVLVGKRRGVFRWMQLLDPDIGRGGLISAESFLASLYDEVEQTRFEELEIPLSVVATDFWRRRAVVFREGPIRRAVQASMAIPGLFSPVSIDDRLLVDGGAVDPVPWDVLPTDCDVTIAIDVTGRRSPTDDLSAVDAMLNAFEIMQTSIIAAKRTCAPPDIYIDCGVTDVRALEFHRLDDVLEQAAPAHEGLRHRLEEVLGRP